MKRFLRPLTVTTLVAFFSHENAISRPVVCAYENGHIDYAISSLRELEGYTDFWDKYLGNQLTNSNSLSTIADPPFIIDDIPKIVEEIDYNQGEFTITLKENHLKLWAVDGRIISLVPVTGDTDDDGNDDDIVSWNCTTSIKCFTHFGRSICPLKELKWPLSTCTYDEELEE